MRIGIDASRTTVARRTGTEGYALNVIRAMLAGDPAHDYLLYFRDDPAPDLFSNGTRRVLPFPRLWTHIRLSFELLAAAFGFAQDKPRPDVLFVPAHVLPLIHPLPSVVTVHDLGYKYFPDAHPFAQRLYLDWSTRFSANNATHVLADSLATKRDLIHFYQIPPDKITVVYPGRDESLRRVDPASVRAKYNLPENYLLHIGTLQPRKNLIRLFEALRLLPSASGLVLAGRPGWLSAPILAKAREHAGVVHLLDYVPDEDLAGLYSGATAFVFPSLYEGFGFPVLEAMACGTPVICSNTSSLPELAGEAALLVDPIDVSALASAIQRVLFEPGLRAALIEKGYQQVQKFSWTKAAQETLVVLEETAGK